MASQNRIFKELDTPPDGSCLFWSVAVNAMLLALNKKIEFRRVLAQLFGEIINPEQAEFLKKLLSSYSGQREDLDDDRPLGKLLKPLIEIFRQRVCDYMAAHAEAFQNLPDGQTLAVRLVTMRKRGEFADEPEIRAISDMLGCTISVFTNQNESRRLTATYNSKGLNLGIMLVFSPAEKYELSKNNHYHFLIDQRQVGIHLTDYYQTFEAKKDRYADNFSAFFFCAAAKPSLKKGATDFNNIEMLGLNDRCAISYDPLVGISPDKRIQLDCKHVFSVDSLSHCEADCCPTCRKPGIQAQILKLKHELALEGGEGDTIIQTALLADDSIKLEALLVKRKLPPAVLYQLAVEAIRANKLKILKILCLHISGDIDNAFTHTRSLIHWAASHGSVESLQLLISAKANINLVLGVGNSPLYLAIDSLDTIKVDILLKAGAYKDIHHDRQVTPFQKAKTKILSSFIHNITACLGLLAIKDTRSRVDALNALLNNAEQTEFSEVIGRYMNDIAADKLNSPAEEKTVGEPRLLQAFNHFKKNIISDSLRIVSHFLSISKHLTEETIAITTDLTACGIDIEVFSSYGAADPTEQQTIDLLRITTKILTLRTEKLAAIKKQLDEETALAGENKINITSYPSGKTKLHHACAKGNELSIYQLLLAQADPNAKDSNGYTPLMWLASLGACTTDEGAALSVFNLGELFSGNFEQVNHCLEYLASTGLLTFQHTTILTSFTVSEPNESKEDKSSSSSTRPKTSFLFRIAQFPAEEALIHLAKILQTIGSEVTPHALLAALNVTQASYSTELLVKYGAKLSAKDTFGSTALEVAANEHNFVVYRSLLKLGVEFHLGWLLTKIKNGDAYLATTLFNIATKQSDLFADADIFLIKSYLAFAKEEIDCLAENESGLYPYQQVQNSRVEQEMAGTLTKEKQAAYDDLMKSLAAATIRQINKLNENGLYDEADKYRDLYSEIQNSNVEEFNAVDEKEDNEEDGALMVEGEEYARAYSP